MVECVRKWIGENCTPKGITMVPKEHRDKVTGGYVVKEPVGQVVKPVGDLREGYGWCCACKVKQVKLPGMLCPSCAKPPVEKGEVSK